MSKLHRGHSIDASYQVPVHLAKRFQRRRFIKIGQSETRIVAAMFGNGTVSKLKQTFCFETA
jgi:hypothetical protein